MIAFTITELLVAVFYGVSVYSRMPDLRVYPFPNDVLGGGLGRLFRLSLTLLGSIKRFGIKKYMRDSCYSSNYVSAVLRRMRSIVLDGSLHPNFCP